MIDPFLTPAAILHLLALIGALVFLCRRWKLPVRDWPFFVVILAWATVVFAAHAASLFHALNRLEVYVPATALGAAFWLGVFRYLDRLTPAPALVAPPEISFETVEHEKARRYLWRFLVATFAFAALSALVLAFSVYPDNADSMIYRLPRAFWYVSNGSFLHPFDSLDKRVTFYPLNGVSIYVPFVLYNLPGTVHAWPSYLAWAMIVYTAYRFARSLGADRMISFFAAWITALTPSILAQSMSTNDEILTASSLLASLYMMWRWMLTGRHAYFWLAAVVMGLSIGTKLHIIFLTPVILMAFGLAAWQVKKKPESLRLWMSAIGARTGLISFVTLVALVVPFLFYNYASCGRFYFFDDFKEDVFNVGQNLQVFKQNLIIYLSQMVFSPIADLNFWPDANARQQFNSSLNELLNPLIMPFIDPNPSFYHMTYRFGGVTIPVSVRFVEFSLWSGFVWLLWPWLFKLTLRQTQFPLRRLFWLIAMTPPIWLLLWCATTLYMEGTATYFAFYLIIASPAMAFLFVRMARPFYSELRWVTIVFVALTNLLISTNMLMYSGFRALPDLFLARTWPYDWDLMDQPIIDEIRMADRIRIIMTHEKMPYFSFMHWHPNAHYYSPYPMSDLKEPEKVLQILPVSSMNRYGFMPLKIPGKKTTGITYIGSMRGIGREAIFALGDDVHKRHPAESNYVLPHGTVLATKEGLQFFLDSDFAGLKAEDELEFSYEMRHGNDVFFKRAWNKDAGFVAMLPKHLSEFLYLTLKVRSALSHKDLTQATYRVSEEGDWLPEGPEY